MNSTPKRKAGGLATGAPSKLRVTATPINGSDHSAKPASVAEESSSSGGSLSADRDTVANSFVSGAVSDSARSTSSHSGGPQTWEHPTAVSDLQENRENPAFCSHSQGALNSAALTSHLTVLYSQQRTVDPLRTTPIYSTTSFQLASSLGSMIPADPRGSPTTSSETTQFRAPRQDLGYQSPPSPALAYPEGSQHDAISTLVAARMHSGSSSVLDPVAPQPSSAPLPSMYWFLFDKDDNSVDPHAEDASSRSPSRLLGSADIAAAAPRVANPTPISFLARWEDMLALERRIRSSFETNLRQAKQAQPSESGLTKLDDHQETFLIRSGKDLFFFFSGSRALTCSFETVK